MAESAGAQAPVAKTPRLENVLLVWRLRCEWVAVDSDVDGAMAEGDTRTQLGLDAGEADV
jgi:hypothetical protein